MINMLVRRNLCQSTQLNDQQVLPWNNYFDSFKFKSEFILLFHTIRLYLADLIGMN